MEKKAIKKKVQAKKAIKRTASKGKTQDAPKIPKSTLQELKHQVKGTWPEAKNLADAKREELAALVERGDAELFKEYQEVWATRSKARHDAWLKGDSKSAEAFRAKEPERTRKNV